MKLNLPYPLVRPLADGKNWKVEEHFTLYFKHFRLDVESGFKTDFASIPKIFHIFFAPATGKYKVPSIGHDKLYRDQKTGRKFADQAFLFWMKQYGVVFIKRQAIYIGVRSGGWVAWLKQKNLKDQQRGK